MDHSNASDSDKVYPVREQSNGVPARSTVALMRGVSEETADKVCNLKNDSSSKRTQLFGL